MALETVIAGSVGEVEQSTLFRLGTWERIEGAYSLEGAASLDDCEEVACGSACHKKC